MLAFLATLAGLVVMVLSPSDLRSYREKIENKLVSPLYFVIFWLDGFGMILCAACIKFALY